MLNPCSWWYQEGSTLRQRTPCVRRRRSSRSRAFFLREGGVIVDDVSFRASMSAVSDRFLQTDVQEVFFRIVSRYQKPGFAVDRS